MADQDRRPCAAGRLRSGLTWRATLTEVGVKLTGPIASAVYQARATQKPAMGKNLHDRYPAARGVFERARRVLSDRRSGAVLRKAARMTARTSSSPASMTVCWAA